MVDHERDRMFLINMVTLDRASCSRTALGRTTLIVLSYLWLRSGVALILHGCGTDRLSGRPLFRSSY